MRYEIIFDYDGEWTSECNLVETFDGSWDGLQDHIKEMRENGCSNITASCYDEEEYEEEDEDPFEEEPDYGPSNPWDAPGMNVSDFIRGVSFF